MYTKSVSSIPTSPLPWARTKSCQRKSVTRLQTCAKATVGHKTISKKLGEKVTTADAILWKWKTIKWPSVTLKLNARSCLVRMIITKVLNQPKATQEDLVNDLKTFDTTVTKNTIGKTLDCNWNIAAPTRHMDYLSIGYHKSLDDSLLPSAKTQKMGHGWIF